MNVGNRARRSPLRPTILTRDPIKKATAKAINDAMIAKRLTPKEIHKLSGFEITMPLLYHWRRGIVLPSIPHAIRLATILDITLDMLFGVAK